MKNKKIYKTMIQDLELEYYVEFRNVKYIRYELRRGKLRLIVPKRNKDDVEEFIHKKDKWLYKKLKEYYDDEKKLSEETKSMNLSQRSMSELKHMVSLFIEKYEKQLNVKVNRLQYRDMVHKWGSCSSLRNITLSRDLRYLPDNLVSYIVYHELTHIIVLAHNDKFYEIIEKEFPDYREYDEDLKSYIYLINKNE